MIDNQTPSGYGLGNYINIQNNEQIDTDNGIQIFEFKRENGQD